MGHSSWAERIPAVKSKADLVYESLHNAIAQGDLKPGERINMDELARRFGISKIPIREAVKRLESDGLLDSRVHAGVTVASVDVTEMRGVFLAREAIETLVASLAAERIDDTRIRELEKIQRAMHAALDAGTTEKMADLNSRFHRTLAETAGYRVLGELTEQLLLTIRRYRITAPLGDRNWRSVVDEHDVIVEALRRHDPEAAADAARAHISSQAAHEGMV
ncbi:GntR family transcriptional regulator [Streptomyces sp. BE20]|uniref:GntR family transcriptional regulator n=1 Tax=Streptomyces sp. BE303 TaxID=3002528 RepID=UPI002E75BF43|nr:GntR family transcriptional regulator [Streptomyces sp. BE303]MED7947449.1 GntR family transcriptional regulator [Streptomyces sp. BE303]MEE1822230.1 GntR family transcriptional regulator [Streptomyces sp. BE20]